MNNITLKIELESINIKTKFDVETVLQAKMKILNSPLGKHIIDQLGENLLSTMNFVEISMKGKAFWRTESHFYWLSENWSVSSTRWWKILLGPGCGYWDSWTLVTCFSWAAPAWWGYFYPQISLQARLCCYFYLQMGNKDRQESRARFLTALVYGN